MFSCLKIPLNSTKFFWIDAPENAPVSATLMFVNEKGEIKSKQLINLKYLDNNLWRGEIPPFSENGHVIITGMVRTSKSNYVIKVGNPSPKVFYQAHNYQEGLEDLEFLQLNENAEVFYYDKMYELGNGFYYGNIKDEVSIVCVEDICSVYHKDLDISASDCEGVDEEEYEECLKKIEEYKEKALLLEKKLAECLSNPTSNVIISPAAQSSALSNSEGPTITVIESKLPNSKLSANISVTEKTNINPTLKTSFSTKLKD